MNISFWQLAWKTLWRDLRAGQLRLLILAVTLAVAALTAVGFFADRLKGGMQRDARQLLGGDAVIVSDQPTPASLQALAKSAGLQAVTTQSFPTMARAGEAQGGATRLVALKAVEPGYPLRGRLTVSAQAGDAAAPTKYHILPRASWGKLMTSRPRCMARNRPGRVFTNCLRSSLPVLGATLQTRSSIMATALR